MPGGARNTGVRRPKLRARELLHEVGAYKAQILSQPDRIPEADRVTLAKMLCRLLADELK